MAGFKKGDDVYEGVPIKKGWLKAKTGIDDNTHKYTYEKKQIIAAWIKDRDGNVRKVLEKNYPITSIASSTNTPYGSGTLHKMILIKNPDDDSQLELHDFISGVTTHRIIYIPIQLFNKNKWFSFDELVNVPATDSSTAFNTTSILLVTKNPSNNKPQIRVLGLGTTSTTRKYHRYWEGDGTNGQWYNDVALPYDLYDGYAVYNKVDNTIHILGGGYTGDRDRHYKLTIGDSKWIESVKIPEIDSFRTMSDIPCFVCDDNGNIHMIKGYLYKEVPLYHEYRHWILEYGASSWTAKGSINVIPRTRNNIEDRYYRIDGFYYKGQIVVIINGIRIIYDPSTDKWRRLTKDLPHIYGTISIDPVSRNITRSLNQVLNPINESITTVSDGIPDVMVIRTRDDETVPKTIFYLDGFGMDQYSEDVRWNLYGSKYSIEEPPNLDYTIQFKGTRSELWRDSGSTILLEYRDSLGRPSLDIRIPYNSYYNGMILSISSSNGYIYEEVDFYNDGSSYVYITYQIASGSIFSSPDTITVLMSDGKSFSIYIEYVYMERIVSLSTSPSNVLTNTNDPVDIYCFVTDSESDYNSEAPYEWNIDVTTSNSSIVSINKSQIKHQNSITATPLTNGEAKIVFSIEGKASVEVPFIVDIPESSSNIKSVKFAAGSNPDISNFVSSGSTIKLTEWTRNWDIDSDPTPYYSSFVIAINPQEYSESFTIEETHSSDYRYSINIKLTRGTSYIDSGYYCIEYMLTSYDITKFTNDMDIKIKITTENGLVQTVGVLSDGR